jgi:hypothetical protein
MNKTPTLLPAAVALLVISACADQRVSGPAVNPSVASVAASGSNASSGLQLHPDGFGEKSYAAWKAHEGIQDGSGNADQALYFQKMTATETFAAGVARITGLEGQSLTALVGTGLGLQWERRDDGWCGAGAPRWNISVTGPGGVRTTIFLGCAAADHTPDPQNAGWTIDTFPGLGAALPAGTSPADFTINGLSIVFDEGTTLSGAPYGLGFVFLDNIKVNDQTWTSPADNGGN